LSGEFFKLNKKEGWNPLLIVFPSNNEIVGIAPLKMRSRFGLRHACNLDFDIYPVLVFFDTYLEICMDKLVEFLFKHLKCQSSDIVLEKNSNLRILEKTCRNTKLHFRETPMMDRQFFL